MLDPEIFNLIHKDNINLIIHTPITRLVLTQHLQNIDIFKTILENNMLSNNFNIFEDVVPYRRFVSIFFAEAGDVLHFKLIDNLNNENIEKMTSQIRKTNYFMIHFLYIFLKGRIYFLNKHERAALYLFYTSTSQSSLEKTLKEQIPTLRDKIIEKMPASSDAIVLFRESRSLQNNHHVLKKFILMNSYKTEDFPMATEPLPNNFKYIESFLSL